MQKNNNVVEYRCWQLSLVELVFNMSTILLYDSRQATPPLVDTVINELLWQSAPNALLFNCATFIKKQFVIHNNIVINSKANKYQQKYKQTILP